MAPRASSCTIQSGSCTTASYTMEVCHISFPSLLPSLPPTLSLSLSGVMVYSVTAAKHALTKIAKGIVKVCKEDVNAQIM